MNRIILKYFPQSSICVIWCFFLQKCIMQLFGMNCVTLIEQTHTILSLLLILFFTHVDVKMRFAKTFCKKLYQTENSLHQFGRVSKQKKNEKK